MRKKIFLVLVLLWTHFYVQAQNNTTMVSVPFSKGYIGTVGSNTQVLLANKSLATMGIERIYFSQTSTTGFYSAQGNDIIGILKFVLLDETEFSLDATITWRVTFNGKIEGIGFIPLLGQSHTYNYNGTDYTIAGLASGGTNILLVMHASALTYNEGVDISGNAAMSGVLDALNSYLQFIRDVAPKGPVTVFAGETCITNPSVSGIVKMRAGETFSVEVDGVKYTPGTALVIQDTIWTLTLPNTTLAGTYEVEAVVKNTYNDILADSTSNELVVSLEACQLPPVANNDTVTVNEDGSITINVLLNDTDPNDDTLTVASVTQPSNGSVVINADGTVTYTPNENFNGTDTFTYTVSDGNGGTATATVTVNVTAVNDAPTGSADPVTTPEDTPVNGKVDGFDVDGDALTFTKASDPANGTVVVNPDGTYTYTPNENYNGTDSFDVEISDGNGGTVIVTVSVTITAVNDAPTGSADPVTTPEDTPVNGKVDGFDVDGDALTFTKASDPANGTVVVNPDGTYTYTPNENFNGTDSFDVEISDGNGGTVVVTVNVTITPVNDAPNAVDDIAEGIANNPITGNVLANDSDIDSEVITVSAFSVNGQTYPVGTTATIEGVGTITIAANGSFNFVPVANYAGTVPTITYTATDDGGASSTANLFVTVFAIDSPNAPVDNDKDEVDSKSVAMGNVFENDKVEGLTLSSIVIDGVTYPVGEEIEVPGMGTVFFSPNGNYTFTPQAGFVGSLPVITYQATSSTGGFFSANLELVVVNTPPVAEDDVIVVKEAQTTTGNVLDNDSDFDDHSLTVTTFTVDGVEYNAGDVVEIPALGTFTLHADGTYTFVPSRNFTGSLPKITYTMTDGFGGFDTAELALAQEIADIFVPEGFSPNGDGKNDTFVIRGLGNYPDNQLRILNRWGNVVYETTNYQNDWDGTGNTGIVIGGNELPEGVYFCILEVNKNVIYKGYILLTR